MRNDLASQEQGFLPWKNTNKYCKHWVEDSNNKCSFTQDSSCSCSTFLLRKLQLLSYTCCSVEVSAVGHRSWAAGSLQEEEMLHREVSIWEKGYRGHKLRTQTVRAIGGMCICTLTDVSTYLCKARSYLPCLFSTIAACGMLYLTGASLWRLWDVVCTAPLLSGSRLHPALFSQASGKQITSPVLLSWI